MGMSESNLVQMTVVTSLGERILVNFQQFERPTINEIEKKQEEAGL